MLIRCLAPNLWGSIGFICTVVGLGWLFEFVNLAALAAAFIIRTRLKACSGSRELERSKAKTGEKTQFTVGK